MKYKQEEGILEYSDNGASFSVVCRIPYINEVAIAKENIGIAYFYSPYFQAASKFFHLRYLSAKIEKSIGVCYILYVFLMKVMLRYMTNLGRFKRVCCFLPSLNLLNLQYQKER